jgi:hypothetical protein
MEEKYTQIDLPSDVLHKIGQVIVDIFVHEAKKDFARRGLSGKSSDGSPSIWDSFSYRLHGQSIEILSTFPLLKQTASPKRPPSSTPRPGVLQRSSGGAPVFQMAPLKLADAWVHPGIHRFSFVERARRAAHTAVLQILKEEAVRAVIRSRQ